MADAQDLKSWVRNRTCRFDPDHRHHKYKRCGFILHLFFVFYVQFFRSAQRATLSGPDRNKLLPALAKNNKLLLFS